MNINKIKIVVIILLVGIFSFIIGRITKKCEYKIVDTIIVDTANVQKPIIDSFKSSQPINKPLYIKGDSIPYPIFKYIKGDSIKDTLYLPMPPVTFISLDSLFYDKDSNNIGVSLVDSGNCSGIVNRKYKFFGSINNQTITNTITKTIIEKPKSFSLYTGIQTSIDADVIKNSTVLLGAQLKNKILIYGYEPITNRHNGGLLIKITK